MQLKKITVDGSGRLPLTVEILERVTQLGDHPHIRYSHTRILVLLFKPNLKRIGQPASLAAW